jgi:hypothetical protein
MPPPVQVIHYGLRDNDQMGYVHCKAMWVNKVPSDRPLPKDTSLGTDRRPGRAGFYFYTTNKDHVTCLQCRDMLKAK